MEIIFTDRLIYKTSIDVNDYICLREAVGWGSMNKEQAQAGIENCFFLLACYHENKIVGSARVIWDGGYIAYLADVMVMPEYQRKGIGEELVNRIILQLKEQLKEGWKIKIVLIAAKGKESFYQKFGFSVRPNEQSGAGMDLWLEM